MILIIKKYALGDVVRASHMLPQLIKKYGKSNIHWYTSSSSLDLLNYCKDIIVSSDINFFKNYYYDKLYCFEEDFNTLKEVSDINVAKYIGAYINSDCDIKYTIDSSLWFDMSLISRFGPRLADKLKCENRYSYPQIFSNILGINSFEPIFYFSEEKFDLPIKRNFLISINFYAGKRWINKEYPENYRRDLIILFFKSLGKLKVDLLLIGIGADYLNNIKLKESFKGTEYYENLLIYDTGESLQYLARLIEMSDLLISTDSLSMHLASSIGIKTVAFFSLSPAHEFEGYGKFAKVLSTSPDYGSLKMNADNLTITPERIVAAAKLIMLHDGNEDLVLPKYPQQKDI